MARGRRSDSNSKPQPPATPVAPDGQQELQSAIEEVQTMSSIEAQSGVNAAMRMNPPESDPLPILLPPPGPATIELFQEIPLYFISGTVSFFRQSYQAIHFSGVRRMTTEEMEGIEERVLALFSEKIQQTGEALDKGWPGLPSDHTLTLNIINRL